MHKGYKSLAKLEIELTQLEKTTVKPVNQGIIFTYFYFEFQQQFSKHFRKISFFPNLSSINESICFI